MGHGSHGSWVKSSMGHLGHGSLWVTHSLLWYSVKIGPLVRPGRRIEKKERAGQSKVTKAPYFTYLGRRPHWTDFYKNVHSSCRPLRNHVCKLSSWNFQGLRFYKGSNFPFSYWFFHGPTTVQRYCAACDAHSLTFSWMILQSCNIQWHRNGLCA